MYVYMDNKLVFKMKCLASLFCSSFCELRDLLKIKERRYKRDCVRNGLNKRTHSHNANSCANSICCLPSPNFAEGTKCFPGFVLCFIFCHFFS